MISTNQTIANVLLNSGENLQNFPHIEHSQRLLNHLHDDLSDEEIIQAQELIFDEIKHKFSFEEIKNFLDLYSETRIMLIIWGIDSSEVRFSILTMISYHYLECHWPALTFSSDELVREHNINHSEMVGFEAITHKQKNDFLVLLKKTIILSDSKTNNEQTCDFQN